MAIKRYKPTSNGQRNMTVIKYKDYLTTDKPHKALTKGKKNNSGRNSDGRLTSRFRGGGNKRNYRMIDFLFDKKNIPAKVETVEYDPYRSAFISLANRVSTLGILVNSSILLNKNEFKNLGRIGRWVTFLKLIPTSW